MTNSFAYHGFDEPRHVAAEVPGDISSALTALAEPVGTRVRSLTAGDAYFEIYRADRVNLTSILFSGGDWRWQFCAPDGTPIAASAGYGSQGECANAVATLRNGAASAEIRGRARG